MRSLTPAQRRQWQEKTLHSPRLRYGMPARLLFRLEDVVFGRGRSVPKFRALEIINRVAYQAWEQAAYYLAGKLRERSARARQLHDTVEADRAEQDNEKWHVLILDELEAAQGRRESWLRFWFLLQLIAFAVYRQFWLMRAFRPSWAYRLNADIEDHAEHQYAQFVAEHPEWDAMPFQSLAAAEYGSYDSLADVIRQIGDDEGVHKRMSLDRLAGCGAAWPPTWPASGFDHVPVRRRAPHRAQQPPPGRRSPGRMRHPGLPVLRSRATQGALGGSGQADGPHGDG